MNKFLEFNGVIQSLFGAGLITILGGVLRALWKNYIAINERNKKLDDLFKSQNEIIAKVTELEKQGEKRQKANLASMHNQIYTIYESVLLRNPPSVTMKELNNLEYLWEGYSGLGGNGTGQNYYERISNLPILEDDEK